MILWPGEELSHPPFPQLSKGRAEVGEGWLGRGLACIPESTVHGFGKILLAGNYMSCLLLRVDLSLH